jgi:alpha-mannosidase
MSSEGMKKLEQLTLKKIQQKVDVLGQYVGSEKVRVTDVAACETMEHLTFDQAKRLSYKPVKEGFRWGKPWSTAWFRLRFTIPASFKGQKVALWFVPNGECILFRDGLPTQGIDVNHKDYLLTPCARGGEKFELYVEAGASDAFGNFQMRTMEAPYIAIILPEVWKAWYDLKCLVEMVVPGSHWTGVPEPALDEESTRRAKIIFGLNKAVDLFNGQDTSREALIDVAKKISKTLKPLYASPAEASAQTFACMGHAHIDVAWLWPLAETIRKCGRTFSTALELMDHYPEYLFCQSQPHLYEFTKNTYPSLYKRIKEKVKKGQWIPTGCAWVEMDCNLAGAESLVRQFLFGTRFFKDEFNYTPQCLWLPDVFGYSGALPQILKRSGMDYFLTQKISWSQFTVFPHHTFMWEGIDGSQVLSHFLPTNDYNAKLRGSEVITAARRYKQKDRSPIQATLYGWGDGGGGPTKEMLEHLSRYKNLEGVPKLVPMSPEKFFKKIQTESVDLPKWVGELYLEFHRGTFTTMAANKKFNRQSELLLRDTEALSAISTLFGGSYAQKELNAAWKTVLLNQFHDIIPGSSIEKVYIDSQKDYLGVLKSVGEVKDKTLASLAKRISVTGEGPAVLAFNSLGWNRSDTITAEVKGLRKGSLLSAIDAEGKKIPAQVGFDGKVRFNGQLPSMGYNVFHLESAQAGAETIKATEKVLENNLIRVKFDAQGCISSVFDKQAGREVIEPGRQANQFGLYEDRTPNCGEAWDVEIFHLDNPVAINGTLESIRVIETGPVRSVLQIKRKISQSTIIQNVILSAGSKRIDFETTVEWGNESQVFLKVAFPVAIRSETARYDIQFGSLERPVRWNTPRDFAQFEVAAHKWADLSEGDYGTAVLNDCKYGYGIRDNVIRLSLLRATKAPNPVADINTTHTFTYAFLPHTGDFRNGVVREGYALNIPPAAMAAAANKGALASTGSWLNVSGENIVLETLKKAEDDSSMIVRLYEAHGSRGVRTISTTLPVKKVIETNLMEKEEQRLKVKNGSVKLNFTPFQIRTLKFVF